MPVYEFRCKDCDKAFDVTASVTGFDATRVECPACGSRNVERHWSSVFAITSKKS